MGPHFFKCGKKHAGLTARLNLPQLQWGRTFSSAEKQTTQSQSMPHVHASMGPHFFKCGKLNSLVDHLYDSPASMGPHFFKCGKITAHTTPMQSMKKLQWGRTFSSAENPLTPPNKTSTCRASMGPHFFKCGKSFIALTLRWMIINFNGAALFQVRKNDREPSRNSMCARLQWGRTFSSAEKSAVNDDNCHHL